jgi:glycosyltransferase involved in cell wall biosynthesis
MKLLYAVQRYGETIVGGSEAATRAFAEQLVLRGHQVEVLTSCAHSYVDWADEYPPGTTEVNGVIIHRLQVTQTRTSERFGPLHLWMTHGTKPAPHFIQQIWARAMGPDLRELGQWISQRIDTFDLAVFMTYLYSTTTLGLPAAAGRIPTILQPTAHEEPPFRVRLYDGLFRLPDSFLFFTPEERAVVQRRFKIDPIGATIGIGIDLIEADPVNDFRQRFGLGENPYLLYVGRIDSIKGSKEAYEFFCAYKARNPGPLRFVFVGEQISGVESHPEVVFTGYVDELTKRNALAGSVAMVQPSRFESFSIVLCP